MSLGRSGAEVREDAKRWPFPLFASRRQGRALALAAAAGI